MSLEDEIRRDLKRQGSAESRTRDPEKAAEWRKAARAAARSLGRPVRTYWVEAVVLAELTDWPANELEEQLQDAQQHNAISRVFANYPGSAKPVGDGPPRPPIPLHPRG